MITINDTKNVNTQWQFVFITFTADGDVCRHTVSTPVLSGEALQAYCDAQEDTYALEVLKQMYPGARPDEDTFESFSTWIAAGHTNAAYSTGGLPYCTIPTVPAHCDGAEGLTQAICEMNGGTWIPEVQSPSTQDACEESEGAWVTVFDTEAKAILAGATWIPEIVITKVPFTDSHNITGDMRTRKLEQLNTELQTYIYTKYDVGTQISFQAIETRADTPEVVKVALGTLFTWISGVMNYYYTKKALIRDGENWNDVTWDFSTFDATDPKISLEDYMG